MLRNGDLHQIGTFGKCVTADASHALRNGDRRQTGASAKCPCNIGNTFRNSIGRTLPARRIGYDRFLVLAVHNALL